MQLEQKEQLQALPITKIRKRDGRIVPFDVAKITAAIYHAAQAVGGKDEGRAQELAHRVVSALHKMCKNSLPTVDIVHDLVEKTLIEEGHAKTAKAYILHRHQKDLEREKKALIMGKENDDGNLDFSQHALKILEKRYLLRDENGAVFETPRQMLERVAKNIAKADKYYGASKEEIEKTQQEFYNLMAQLKFLPNSPTLMNAGTKTQQLSSCFVLPIEDSMSGIFSTLKDAALIHQRGSGTGFSFSRLRPQGDVIKSTHGVAAGPVSFMQVYDRALDAIKQGGVRPGANMAVMRVDHPDIIRFIDAKRHRGSLCNFNQSVAVTDRFMKAVENDKEYHITNPRTQKYVGRLRARDVFAMITQNAWKRGDPGLLFIDEINRKHAAAHLGEIETTNQCGEAPLLPYEGIVLGSLNLNKFVNEEKTDLLWDELRRAVAIAVHFLDNVIDMNSYPSKRVEENTKRTRKFGLGIMGFADVLALLGIKYDSQKGLDFAEELTSFIRDAAYHTSSMLAQKRGIPPGWQDSSHHKIGKKIRNLSCLSIAPTGTISILADASSGCEPFFAISYYKTVFGDTQLVYLNKTFERIAKEKGFYSPELIRKITQQGTIQGLKEVPKDVREVFVTSQDISPHWHVQMQSTLQKNIDNSISKTINFPRTASIKDVEDAYVLAWKGKCKGITIYRDGSYEDQVITIGSEE